MCNLDLKLPWPPVVQANTGVRLWLRTVIISSVIFAVFCWRDSKPLGVALVISVLVSSVSWVLMLPNWAFIQRMFLYESVRIEESGNWFTFKLPTKEYRVWAHFVRVKRSPGHTTVDIRFPFSLFYFYSRFSETVNSKKVEQVVPPKSDRAGG